MPRYLEALNQDLNYIRTSARWDATADQGSGPGAWMTDSAMWTQNDSGVWVPVSSTNPAPVKVTNSIPAGANVIGGVTGDVAHDAADSGAPVKVGGYASTAAPTAVSAGDRVNAWWGLNGQLNTTVRDSGGVEVKVGQFANVDTNAPTNQLLGVGSHLLAFNDSTAKAERLRNNTESTLLVSAARAATTPSANQTNYNAGGVVLTLNITANPGGSETLELQLRFVDPTSGTSTTSICRLAIPAATNGPFRLIVYPGASGTPEGASNKAYALPIPRTWMANVYHSGSGSWTYSLSRQDIVA